LGAGKLNKSSISREATPDEEERAGVAQREILRIFAEHQLTDEEGLSALTWLAARIMCQSCSWPPSEWAPAFAARLQEALRLIEEHERKGKVPLA